MASPTQPKRYLRGFSLVELMVVILLMGILAGLIFSVADGIFAKGDRSRARAELQAISLALENYRQRFGDYPAVETPRQLFMALNGELGPRGDGLDPVFPPFLESGRFSVGDPDAPELLDPWGQPYQYDYEQSEGEPVQSGYLLFSRGPDMKSSVTGNSASPENQDNLWPDD